MPIEQKALAEARADEHSLSALDLRDKGASLFRHFIDNDELIEIKLIN